MNLKEKLQRFLRINKNLKKGIDWDFKDLDIEEDGELEQIIGIKILVGPYKDIEYFYKTVRLIEVDSNLILRFTFKIISPFSDHLNDDKKFHDYMFFVLHSIVTDRLVEGIPIADFYRSKESENVLQDDLL